MHVLQCPSGYPLTTELSNEVFTREVLRRLFSNGILKKFGFNVAMSTPGIYHFGSGYDPWIKIWYNFMELIPQKDLCKFQFQLVFNIKKIIPSTSFLYNILLLKFHLPESLPTH
jgi:hypothetical protein